MAWASEGVEERRDSSQARIATCRPVTIVTGGRSIVVADTVDLGPGGMFVALEDPLPVGERFIFRIDLGNDYKPVLSGGEVRWIDEREDNRGMGVQFLDIAEVADAIGGGEIPTRGPGTVRVRMEHVGPAIEAQVVERSSSSLVVDLSLPFLRQGAPLEVGPDVSARSGRVQSAEWIAGEDRSAALRLVVDLDPISASGAAGQMAAVRPTDDVVAPARPVICRPRTAAPAVAEEPEELALEATGETTLELDEVGELEAAPSGGPDGTPPSIEAEDAGGNDEEDAPSDEIDEAAFSPLHGLRERLASLGVLAALSAVAGWLRGRSAHLAARLAEHPRGRAALELLRTKVDAGLLRAAAGKVGAAARSLWLAVRSSPLLKRRPRKQTRGEPSKVVQSLTARARKAASGRGRTIATVLLVALGAGGLATTGYGLWASHAVEVERRARGAEAERAGWSAEAWQEPEDPTTTRG